MDNKTYRDFVEKMVGAEKPVGLQMQEPDDLTFSDIKNFFNAFKHETGIDIKCTLFTCDDCDRLHMLLVVGEED